MNAIDERVRAAMNDLADRAQPADMLVRLDAAGPRRARNGVRAWALAAAVVVLVTVLAAAVVALLRSDEPSIVEPVDRPPKVFRLGAGVTAAPGPVRLAVTLVPEDPEAAAEVYVVGAGGAPASLVPGSERVPRTWTRHLSLDGTRLMLQFDDGASPRLEVVDLRTGSRDDLGGTMGYCPQLSPDHRTVVMWRLGDEVLQFVDTRTREMRLGSYKASDSISGDGGCTALAWSPDGRLLAIPSVWGSRVVDLRGNVRHRLPDRYAVNGSMSWSPDGRRLLLYDRAGGRFVVHDLESGRESGLGPPQPAWNPQGWAGSRVVWLTGRAGVQRLVTTDQDGRDLRTWTRLEVGNRVVASANWSRDLSGWAAD